MHYISKKFPLSACCNEERVNTAKTKGLRDNIMLTQQSLFSRFHVQNSISNLRNLQLITTNLKTKIIQSCIKPNCRKILVWRTIISRKQDQVHGWRACTNPMELVQKSMTKRKREGGPHLQAFVCGCTHL